MYATLFVYVCVCVNVCADPLHQRGLCMAADSLSSEDISQKGRRRSRSNPEGCSFSQPSGSLSSLLPSPSSSTSPCHGWGRRRKLLLCSTFAGSDPATRMRDPPCSRLSWFPSQARGKTLFQTRTRDEPFRRSSVAREDPSK